jgi:hypothetical protein
MKYRIDITQTVIEGATVYVEANSQEEAENAALQLAKGNTVQFRFCDVVDDMEIINVEEWPPVHDPEPPFRGPAMREAIARALPEGVEVVSLEDPAAMHRAIARAIGEGE